MFSWPPLSVRVFSRRRTKLRTVTVMLMAWLFALVAGVVNACVLQVKVTDHHQGHQPMHSASTVIETHAHPPVLPQIGLPAPADDPSSNADSGKAQCKSLCDSEAAAAAAKQQGQAATDLAQGPEHVLAFTPYLPLLATAKQSFDDRPPPGAPMVIRFLRLTI